MGSAGIEEVGGVGLPPSLLQLNLNLRQLGHSTLTTVYRASSDLFLAPRFARHASPLTTDDYTHPSDDESR